MPPYPFCISDPRNVHLQIPIHSWSNIPAGSCNDSSALIQFIPPINEKIIASKSSFKPFIQDHLAIAKKLVISSDTHGDSACFIENTLKGY